PRGRAAVPSYVPNAAPTQLIPRRTGQQPVTSTGHQPPPPPPPMPPPENPPPEENPEPPEEAGGAVATARSAAELNDDTACPNPELHSATAGVEPTYQPCSGSSTPCSASSANSPTHRFSSPNAIANGRYLEKMSCPASQRSWFASAVSM